MFTYMFLYCITELEVSTGVIDKYVSSYTIELSSDRLQLTTSVWYLSPYSDHGKSKAIGIFNIKIKCFYFCFTCKE